MELTEKVLHSHETYAGPTVQIEHQQVMLPDGRIAEREIVHHQPAVAILLITKEQKVVLVKQWRTPVAGSSLEIPAGKVEPGEDFLAAAVRELNEETRLQADKLSKVTGFFTSPGFTDEFMTLYYATNSTSVKQRLPQDADENLQLIELSQDDAIAAIQSGKIQDAKTIMAIWYWRLQTGGR